MTLPTPTRFMIGPDTFRHRTLSAAEEFHCVRRVAPVVKNTSTFMFALADAGDGEEVAEVDRLAGVIEGSAPLLKAFADLSEDDSNYVIARCMGATEMLDGEAWVPTWDLEVQSPAVPSLRMIHVLRICYAVLREAITVFFSEALSSLTELGLLRRTIAP
ncbi:phage tail assembly chaperone [Methylobacterium sp. J-076]|uniref:phage tail assembly chaperone n=1 Tax=Methylobacterium sp. J-076 TaxID=2836655 RepID=UPI001FBBED1A|nr:hypothetical protein [Methylobacterium sp. J-076]MCJ2012664.1 hypothetical protein [Methylobacterium sp. J-076]